MRGLGLPFRRGRSGVHVRLGVREVEVLRTLSEQLLGLLGPPPQRASRSAIPDVAEGDDEGAAFREIVAGLSDVGGLPETGEPEPGAHPSLWPAERPVASAPADPALARLLPDAYRDDPRAAAEYRRYTESGLRAHKRAAQQIMLESLGAGRGRGTLGEQEALAWVEALNDLRLALGARLEVDEDLVAMLAAIPRGDPRRDLLAIYDWLGSLQESLLHAMGATP